MATSHLPLGPFHTAICTPPKWPLPSMASVVLLEEGEVKGWGECKG